MLNSNHYVPILKWKRAEQGALKSLAGKYKNITPLIQFVMPKAKPTDQLEDVIKKFEEQLSETAKKIYEIWGNAPIFIDVSLLFSTELKAKSLETISVEGQKLGGSFIPVVYLNDEKQIKDSAIKIVKSTNSGLCLRLICSDFSDMTKLNQDISSFISLGLGEKEIDLLVDIKETEKSYDKYDKYIVLSQNILSLLKWRTFIFASGSFPKDLSECKLDEENLLPRVDWMGWKNHSKGLRRRPTFSDYTIQHPIYKETSQFFHPTSSIKYTLDESWLIMKGRKQKFELYLASAAELIKDKRFYGENFSDGDKYISEKAKHFPVYMKNPAIKGTGSTETWLKAGINHHLVVVAHQISNLP